MDPSTEEYKVTKDLFYRNIDVAESIRERTATEFGKKYEKDPDFIANEECAASLNAANAAMQAGKIPESAGLMARGSLCFGKLFRSPKYAGAIECMTKSKNNPEPCIDILSDLLDDVMQTREKSARQNMPVKVREVNDGLDKAGAALFKRKGITEEELSISVTSYVLTHYCPSQFQKLMACAKANGGNTSKCRIDVEKSIECETNFQLENVLAMMRPSKK